MQRVLVLRRGGLGDTLLMLPVLRALARAQPAAEVHFAGVAEFAAVLLAYGACHRARSSEDLALWSPERAAASLRDYDLVVADDPAAGAVHANVRTFDPRPVDARPLALQIAAQLGLQPRWPDDAWLLPPREAVRDGPTVFAPGSGGAGKCWPRAHWLALAQRLPVADLQVLVGPVECERDDPRGWMWPVTPRFVVEPSLVTVAERLAAAAVFVGNDSGPSHLAAALGVPTVVVFGPSDARVFAPVGPHVQVVDAGTPDLALLDVAPVHAAMAQAVHGSRARTRCQ